MESTKRLLTGLKTLRQHLPGTYKKLVSRGKNPKLPLKTLPGFNRKIWGLHTGLTVIGSRTSQGKSSFSLQIAYDLASQNFPVLFLSLEMDEESLVERLFCNSKKVDNFDLLTGKINNEDIKSKWDEFSEEIKTIPLLITNGIGKTFSELTELVEIMNPKPKVIIIDYIQVIKQVRDEREVLNEYLRNLRQYCVENDIAGVICSQSNRQTLQDKGREPTLNTLKGTGVLEEISDVVLLLHWDNFYTKDPDTFNNFKIIVAKNRNGMTGSYEVSFYPHYYRFEELSILDDVTKVFN